MNTFNYLQYKHIHIVIEKLIKRNKSFFNTIKNCIIKEKYFRNSKFSLYINREIKKIDKSFSVTISFDPKNIELIVDVFWESAMIRTIIYKVYEQENELVLQYNYTHLGNRNFFIKDYEYV